MKIYYGKDLNAVKSVLPQGTLVFEERFKKFSFLDYAECWKQLIGANVVICKTRDAMLAAPEAAIYRVDRTASEPIIVRVQRDQLVML